ncbi:MAG: NYN domain-containing protein, partial [Chloroflexota bacterium]
MSKNVAMFVDVANMYYAARGQDVDVDYVALLKHATKGRDLIRAYAYSGLDPENENQRKFLDFLTKNGYKVVSKDIRKFGDGRVKANLDIELVVDLFRLGDRMDIAVIVSGDGDFASAIRALQDKGVRCEVISFRPNTSSDLMAVADEFMDIMKVASIERGKGMKVPGMAAPEMPAKEVNPEFGFREASRSVAAAALSALRGGGGGDAAPPARGRGRTRPAAATPVASAEGAATEAAPRSTPATLEADGDEAGKRRRRRRGGRGRGRRREEPGFGDAETLATGDPDTEIGWEELDDVSQVSGATPADALGDPDAEIGFEEVDPDTLAELGIEAPAAEAEEKPKRATRSRARKADTEAAAPAEAEEKPKRATRSRARKADTEAAAPAEAEEKP